MLYRYEVDTAKENLLDVTPLMEQAVAQSGVQNGMCLAFCPHEDAGLALLEKNTDTVVDFLSDLDRLMPQRANTAHPDGGQAYAAACKSALLGVSRGVAVSGAALQLAANTAVYLCEYQGAQRRTLYVKVYSGGDI